MARGRSWYQYSMLFNALDNGGSDTQRITIQAGQKFVWTHAMAYVTESVSGLPFLAYQGAMSGGAIVPSWPLLIDLEQNGDMKLTNEEVPLSCVFGDGVAGRKELTLPMEFDQNSIIVATLRRISEGQFTAAGVATNLNMLVRLVFEGYRIHLT